MSRRAEGPGAAAEWVLPALLAAAFAAALGALGRGITQEDWDGVKAINNALLLAGAQAPLVPLDLKRPPLAWLLASPWLAAGFRAGGPWGALQASHAVMPAFAGILVFASFRFFRGLFPLPLSLLLAGLLAANPMLIQFSPFALADTVSGLAVLAVLGLGRRYLERPGHWAFAALAAACVLAFLSKYHLGLLALVPVAARLLAPGALRRPRELATPLWLLPAIVCAAGAGALSLVVLAVYGGAIPPWREAQRELWANFSFNVLTPKPSPWHLYLGALRDQLGWALSALACAGAWSWLRRRGAQDRLLAAGLLLPLLAMSFAIPNKEARYALPLLPLLYAAAGEGLRLALGRLPAGRAARPAALAATLALVPWATVRAAVRHLREEPSIRTPAPWELARLAEAESRPGDCVGWLEGEVAFPIEEPLFRYERSLLLGAPTFQFFVGRTVQELGAGREGRPGCRLALIVVPREGTAGPRWAGPPLARVSLPGQAPGSVPRDWEVHADGLREAARPAPGGRP